MRRPALDALVQELCPGGALLSVEPLGDDAAADRTEKGFGYGRALRLSVREADGCRRDFVLHTATANEFGHDRRSDRAAQMLLAFDSYRAVPDHVAAIDVGAVDRHGRLRSLRDCGEFYVVTDYAPGRLYADELRRIAAGAAVDDADLDRVDHLARYLAALHRDRGGPPAAYARAIRDLVGHGEGVYGIVDGYPPDVPGAPLDRLAELEQRVAGWRWKLRGRHDRLCRVHGDFHPFNILFDDRGNIALLDASRGCRGDAADDVTCLAINYVFFALTHPGTWAPAFSRMWYALWRTYLDRSGDREVVEVAPPYFAWRALVLANPRWYPRLTGGQRDALLGLAERVLDAERVDPEFAEELFR
ncbi:MAG: aminoglycoside phosphotransferase family protein [Deltaproteobacteria bacterium]|nr:MAG: aminoglycoside phosphotransferase family protein [Deltaproteobacteria bacterium]